MRWSDSHCHSSLLSSPELLAQLEAAGCLFLVQGGIDPEDWSTQTALLSLQAPSIIPVFGLHPWTVADSSPEQLETALLTLSAKAGVAAGIGEIGLDPLRGRTPAIWQQQRHFFVRQLQLAAQLGKPCVFHIVRAYPEAWSLIGSEYPSVRGLVHSFWAPAHLAKPYLDAGLILSLPPRIQQTDPHGILRYVPRQQVVFESDAPQKLPGGDSSTPFAALASILHAAGVWAEAPELVAERQIELLKQLFARR